MAVNFEKTTAEQLTDVRYVSTLLSGDVLVTAEILVGLSQRAKALGVKGQFDTIVKAVQASKRLAMAKDGVTDFDLPSDSSGVVKYKQALCGEWIANDNGIHRIGAKGEKLEACSHPILPVRSLCNAQDGRVKVVLAFCRNHRWKEIIVDKSVIASANKIVSLSDQGIMVTSENAKQLVAFLERVESMNPDTIKVYTSTSKLGWTASGFMPYTQDIIFDAENSVANVYKSIAASGDYAIWKDKLKSIRKSQRIEFQLYMAASFASPYVSQLNMLPFIVNICGMTGNGKTVCAMLATSVWANPELGRYILKASGTIASWEAYLDLLNHLPAIVDDFAQVKKRYGDKPNDFSEEVYMLCSGMSKNRSNTSLGLQRQRTWKNAILTTSEQSLISDTSQGGMINRIIEVESESVIFNKKAAPGIVQTISENYGYAGKDFIESVTVEEVTALWNEMRDKLTSEAEAREEDKEEKQILPMALLMAIDQLVTDKIFGDGVYMDFEECYQLLKSKEQVSEYDRAYEALNDFVTMHTGCFVWDEHTREYYGKFMNDEKTQVAILGTALNVFCEEAHMSRLSFLKWLDRQGHLIKAQNTLGKSVRLDNGRYGKCYVIKLPNDEESAEMVNVDDDDELPFA